MEGLQENCNMLKKWKSLDITLQKSSSLNASEGDIVIKKANMILKNAQPIDEIYKISKKAIGTGGYGVVSKCQHRITRQFRACKCVSKKKVKNLEQFKAEISILQQLDHPHILKLYEYFEDDKNFYLVTELCSGGELFDKIIEK